VLCIPLSSPVAQQSKSSCTECGSNILLRDPITGELICQKCGLVISSNELSYEPEWRAFDAIENENRQRTGAPLTYTIHDKGLSTNIGWRNRDAAGRELSEETRARLYRLRKWHRRSKVSDNRNRNLSIALAEMSNIQSKLNLPRNVIETGSVNYRRAINSNLVRGRTIQGMVVACVYMACRQCGVLRSLEEVADVVNISKKNASRYYRLLVKELDHKVPQVDPYDFISKIVNKLRLNGDTERVAKNILYQANLMKLTGGRGPAGIAAACVYISTRITCDLRTQSDIAREAQVTEVTIRNRYKEIIERIQFNISI